MTVAAGAAITASYIATQSALCPSQKFVLSGYSKGALVLHGVFHSVQAASMQLTLWQVQLLVAH